MRPALLLLVLALAAHGLAGCETVSTYDPAYGANASNTNATGGEGIQTSIWSDDPNKKTLVNQIDSH